MPQWEYDILIRSRNLVLTGSSIAGMARQYEPQTFSPNGDEMKERINQMGRDGWELVNVLTRQSQHNSPLTTEEVWVFKRPVS